MPDWDRHLELGGTLLQVGAVGYATHRAWWTPGRRWARGALKGGWAALRRWAADAWRWFERRVYNPFRAWIGWPRHRSVPLEGGLRFDSPGSGKDFAKLSYYYPADGTMEEKIAFLYRHYERHDKEIKDVRAFVGEVRGSIDPAVQAGAEAVLETVSHWFRITETEARTSGALAVLGTLLVYVGS